MGALSGLDALRISDDPIAAAIAYGMVSSFQISKIHFKFTFFFVWLHKKIDEQSIIVIDMGAGFNIIILSSMEGNLKLKSDWRHPLGW